MTRGACGWLREQRVRHLVLHKRRLVEVPYTATLAHTVNALVANDVVAVPVAAPPGRWIGAGGSMILESDRATGAVRKQYIGMATMLDVLVHIAEVGDPAAASEGEPADLEKKMSVPVYEVIGHSLEGSACGRSIPIPASWIVWRHLAKEYTVRWFHLKAMLRMWLQQS